MLKNLVCDPALFEKDLSGRVYIVTGANGGAGLATTAQLARQGAHVVAACRRVSVGEEATRPLADEQGSVEVMELDLSSLDSVRAFADAFLDKHDRLDGLVNNAGIMASPRGRTQDGFETQFGINHLGHFLLTELLLDRLQGTAAETGDARVILVSSVAHAGFRGEPGEIDLDDLFFERRDYTPFGAYCQSKLAMVIYARHLAKRLEGTGVYAFSVHPGWIRSNLVKHTMPPFVQNVLMRPFSKLLGMMSGEEGAQTTLHCLLDGEAREHSGEYYSQNSPFYNNKDDRPGGWPMRSPNPRTYDDELAVALYEKSKELVGLET